MSNRDKAIRFLTNAASNMAYVVPSCISPGIMFTMDINRMRKKADLSRIPKMRSLFLKNATSDFKHSIKDCFNLTAAAYFIESDNYEAAGRLLSRIDTSVKKNIPDFIWKMLGDSKVQGGKRRHRSEGRT
jgi:hypothetical protein